MPTASMLSPLILPVLEASINWRKDALADQYDENNELIGGSFPAGKNGPYGDKETHCRNSAHWLIIFISAWRLTNKTRYKDMALRELDFLLSESPGHGRPFICREPTQRLVDRTNGVIGQAWIMEGLIYAAEFLGCSRALREAERLYSIHTFDNDLKMWRTCNPDGSVGRPDNTFNHQLWFCSVAMRLPAVRARTEEVGAFMRFNGASPATICGGIIRHNSQIGRSHTSTDSVRPPRQGFRRALKTIKLIPKSIAYHPFNLYAYCSMYTAGWDTAFFKREEFKRLVRVCSRQWCGYFFYSSVFGSRYNPVGFELLYVKQCFPELVRQTPEELLRKQLAAAPLYSLASSKETDDNATLNSRVYELAKIALDCE